MSHPFASFEYAAAFDHSSPLAVTAWGTAVCLRPIPNTPHRDLAGCYPLMPIAPTVDLRGGLDELVRSGSISFVAVTDPYFAPSFRDLASSFPLCRPFKTHFVIDRTVGPLRYSRHHRYQIRRAERICTVRITTLSQVCDLWCDLYARLVARHEIIGSACFSDSFFRALSRQTGFIVFLAEVHGAVVGASLWVRYQGVAYYFLNTSTAEGYAVGASYLLMAAACEHYGDCQQINLGGVSGAENALSQGLAQFKRGFTNTTVDSHIIGAVLNPAIYSYLSMNDQDTSWFPAYRS